MGRNLKWSLGHEVKINFKDYKGGMYKILYITINTVFEFGLFSFATGYSNLLDVYQFAGIGWEEKSWE